MVQAVIATTVTGLQGRGVANTAPTLNQALVWNGSAWAPSGPYLTAAGAPYIATNYVDNSGFSINQRGYASGSPIAAGAYGFDRWKAGASGCTLTFTVSPASTLVTVAAGTIQQVIEGNNLINASYTLSWLGSATGRVNTGTYVASPITFTGAPNTNVTIEFQGGTLGQVQLQIGTQASLWQPIPITAELIRCQRFYYNQLQAYFGGYSGGTITVIYTMLFPVYMRTTPTITIVTNADNGITSPGQAANSQLIQFTGQSPATSAGWIVNRLFNASADL